MMYEYRSNKKEGLAFMDRFFDSVIASFQTFGIELQSKLWEIVPAKEMSILPT